MAILGNQSLVNMGIGFCATGATSTLRSAYFVSRNITKAFSEVEAIPKGSGGQSFLLPQKPGSIASRYLGDVTSSGTISMAAGRNLVATGNSELVVTNADLRRIVTMIMSASATLSKINGNLSAAATGQASGQSVLSGSAHIGAIISAIASSSSMLSGNAFLSALAHMIAEAGGPAPLSPEGLARAVWNANSSEFNTSGTMGARVNSASGSGGSSADDIAQAVLDKITSSGLTVNQALSLLEAVNEKLTELHKIQGLDSSSPMTVTQYQRTAGEITLQISGDGIDTSTVTRV